MADGSDVIVSGAVEGNLDEALLRRLVEEEGATLRPPYGKKDKQHPKQMLVGWLIDKSPRISFPCG